MKKLLSVFAIAAILVACNDTAEAPVQEEAPATEQTPVETPATDSTAAPVDSTVAPTEAPAQ